MEYVTLQCCRCGKDIIRSNKAQKAAIKRGSIVPHCSADCWRETNKLENLVVRNCLRCGKEFNSTNKKKYKKCCSLACARVYSANSNKEIANIKRSKSAIEFNSINKKPNNVKKFTCKHCENIFESRHTRKYCSQQCYISNKIKLKKINVCRVCGEPSINNNKTCSDKCRSKLMSINGRVGGIKSMSVQNRRSKNEILFHDMVKEKFPSTLNNVPMFNGWDADIIIPELKVAILWNGNWHHKKITQKHSVLQVQNRDKIKIKEIQKYGYSPYIIDDFGSYDEKFTKEKFSKFMDDYASSSKQIVS